MDEQAPKLPKNEAKKGVDLVKITKMLSERHKMKGKNC